MHQPTSISIYMNNSEDIDSLYWTKSCHFNAWSTSKMLSIFFSANIASLWLWFQIFEWFSFFAILPGLCQYQQQFAHNGQPQDHSAVEGGTARLRCKIADVQGPVQWTKDGVVMGYDRDIPSFPRYSMIGSEQLGKSVSKSTYRIGSLKPFREDESATYILLIVSKRKVLFLRDWNTWFIFVYPWKEKKISHVPDDAT